MPVICYLFLLERGIGHLRIYIVKYLSRLTHWVLKWRLEPYSSEQQKYVYFVDKPSLSSDDDDLFNS